MNLTFNFIIIIFDFVLYFFIPFILFCRFFFNRNILNYFQFMFLMFLYYIICAIIFGNVFIFSDLFFVILWITVLSSLLVKDRIILKQFINFILILVSLVLFVGFFLFNYKFLHIESSLLLIFLYEIILCSITIITILSCLIALNLMK